MDSAWRMVQPRHVVGLLLISLLGAAPYVPALAGHPTGLRNFTVLALDVGFVLPVMLATARGGRNRRERARSARAVVTVTHASPEIRAKVIALAALASFAAAWALCPADAPVSGAWFGILQPLVDAVRHWSGSIGRLEQDLVAQGRADAVIVGSRLALLWIVPGLVVIAGFLLRWLSMTGERAEAVCLRNRARFGGTEVLRTSLDRLIVVLFVWHLPLTQAGATAVDPAVLALAQQITLFTIAARGGTLLMLAGLALEWAGAELFWWQRRVSAFPARHA